MPPASVEITTRPSQFAMALVFVLACAGLPHRWVPVIRWRIGRGRWRWMTAGEALARGL